MKNDLISRSALCQALRRLADETDCDIAVLPDVADLIRTAPAVSPESLRPRWVSVKDRLPRRGEVLVTNSLVMAVAPASSVRKHDTAITHWMPLPELPEEGATDAETP